MALVDHRQCLRARDVSDRGVLRVQDLPHVTDLESRVLVGQWHEAEAAVDNGGEDGVRGCGLGQSQQVAHAAREELVVAL